MAQCPSHPDEKASLHVTQNGRGIAVKCHAGCDTEQILKDLDLEFDDLFFDQQASNGVHREIVATYDYKDEHGRLLYQVVRYQPKEFRQRRPDGHGDWEWNVRNTRKVPYQLDQLVDRRDEPVFIVEGEKDVAVLHAHGFLATTNAGGAGKWMAEWTPIFKDRRVFLIPDNDEPGLLHMEKVGALLSEVADVRTIYLPAKDTAEFFLAREGAKEQFQQLTEEALPYGQAAPVIEDEDENLDKIEFPEAPVHDGILGEIVKLVEPHTEADPVGIFVELMTAFGNCLGPGPHVLVQGATKHRCNLFIALTGLTSKGRKGSAHDWMRRIFEAIDPNYVTTCFYGGLASGEGLIHAVRDPKTKTNKKGEVEVIDEGVADKRKLFFEPELAGRTFTAMHREGSTLAAVLKEAWDGNHLAVATKQSDDRATNPHISLVGHTTFKELSAVLRPTDLASGTANRFLFFAVSRSKQLPHSTEPDRSELGRLVGKLAANLSEARKLTQVELTDEAKELWGQMYYEIDGIDTADESVNEYLGRGLPQVNRMALILSLAEGKNQVTADALRQALGFFHYVRASVEYLMGTNDVFKTKDEEKLYKLLEKEGPLHTDEIKRRAHMPGGKVRSVLGALVTRKILTMEQQKPKGGVGRPRKVYYT